MIDECSRSPNPRVVASWLTRRPQVSFPLAIQLLAPTTQIMLPSPQFHTPNLVFRAPELTDRPWLLQLAMAPDVLMKASAGVTKPVSTEVEHPDNVKFWERLQGFLLS